MKLKTIITDCLFRLYYPYIIRKEKFIATRMWREGVRLCENMYKEINSPRVYLFFDSKHMVWSPMTYEPNKMLKPALKQLRTMGKLRGASSITNVEDAKRSSYYYTPSKWGAKGIDDNCDKEEKLRQWVSFYMLRLSEPMKSVRQYQQEHPYLLGRPAADGQHR